MPRPSLDDIFASNQQAPSASRPSLDDIFGGKIPAPEPDSIAKNIRGGMNPVKAAWTQIAEHPVKSMVNGLPETAFGSTLKDTVEANSPKREFTPEQAAKYKSDWGVEPGNFEKLKNPIDQMKSIGAWGVDTATAPMNLLLGPAFKGAAGVASKIPGIKNKLADMALSPEFAQSKSDAKYGHDARRVLKDMPDVAGDDIHSTGAAIQQKIHETGQAIGDTIANHPNAGTKLKAREALVKPFDDRIAELNIENPVKNKTAIKRLQDAKFGIVKVTDKAGAVKGQANLDSMTPQELFNFRKAKIDKTVKFTGNASDDAVVNEAYQEARSNVRNILNDTMPELKPLNKDYGDLSSASDAIERLSFKAQKEGLPGLGLKDIASMGITKWINNPINRVKLARWLYTAPKAQVAQVSKMIPGFQQAVDEHFGPNMPGYNSTSPTGIRGFRRPFAKDVSNPNDPIGTFEGEGGPTVNKPLMDFNPIKPNPKNNPIEKLMRDNVASNIKDVRGALRKGKFGNEGMALIGEPSSNPYNPSSGEKIGYRIIDPITGQKVGSDYSPNITQMRRANTRLDKLNNEYGRYKYDLKPVYGAIKDVAKSPLGLAAATGIGAAATLGSANAAQSIDIRKINQIESSGNPKAIGDNGKAFGLNQIHLPVLSDYNKANKAKLSKSDLMNADTNNKVADWYFNKEIPRMLKAKGHPDTTKNRIVAYNAGISHVGRSVLPKSTYDYIKKYTSK